MSAVADQSTVERRYRPPTITPPSERLGVIGGLSAIFRNPITFWPEEMYDGGLIADRSFGRLTAHVADPALARRVLLDDAECYGRARLMMIVLEPALGAGMLTTDGETWRRQRRIAAPSFRIQELRAMTPAMSAAGAEAGARLARRAGSMVDVTPEMIHATFDVITDAILGEEGRALVDRDAFAADVDTYVNTLGQVDPFDVMGAPRWLPRPWKWRALGATRRIRATAARVVAARRAAGAAGPSLVDRLIRAVDPEEGGGLTDREVLDNIVTFFGAGHETTAMGLTWTLSILAQLPELQDALRAEAARVAGDAPIGAEHLPLLTLHEQVFKETLRLYPPAALLARKALAPTRLGDLDIAPGDEIVIATYVMHRSRALWDRPDAFDPSRFAPDAPLIDRFAYLPFGGGPRICIGMSFALMEGVAILAEILRRARFAPGPARAIEPRMRVTLRPTDGMRLAVSAA